MFLPTAVFERWIIIIIYLDLLRFPILSTFRETARGRFQYEMDHQILSNF